MTIKNIDAKSLKKMLDNNEAILVDVRELGEYRVENIAGSNLIPLAKFGYESLPDCHNKKLVIHCKKGGRSMTACEHLRQEMEDLEIYNLEGGIEAWKKAGYEVKKSKKFSMPFYQQAQLIIGLGVLTGSILGYFINPLFFILSGFFGAGLVFSSITGFCGLAMLLAKMPWNKEQHYSCLIQDKS